MTALDDFPISIAAYIADTQHLSTVQHGAYLLLLMTMRRAGGWIADDDRKLANIVKLSPAKWRQIAPDIRSLLVARDGKLSQKRVLSDLEKHMLLSSKNAQNGRSGGVAKALKNKEPGVATATISPADRQPARVNAIPSSSNLFSDSEISKKASGSRGSVLPGDWLASEADHAYGEKLGLTRVEVEACGEDMRLWARANANRAVGRKADWPATFHGWMRREAPKVIRQRSFKQGGGNEANRSGGGNGFSTIAARLRYGPRTEPDAGRPAPEDLEPVNRR